MPLAWVLPARPLGRNPLPPSAQPLSPSAPLPLKLSSTFFSRKPSPSKKEHTSSTSQVGRSMWSSERGYALAAAGRMLGGVLGLPSQRGRFAGCSGSALCMATCDSRRSEIKYRGTRLARSRTDATALEASPFSGAIRAYCAGALDISRGSLASLRRQRPAHCASAMICALALNSAPVFPERAELLEKICD